MKATKAQLPPKPRPQDLRRAAAKHPAVQ
eukprot:SAG31_NODE_38894_length_292_cov_1.093264_1_plen_28_part_10